MWIDDSLLERFEEPVAVSVWVPDKAMVVLGSSNDASLECDVDACAHDGVPVLRRYGGGGAVVLYPGCIIVSVGMWVRQHFQNDLYFKLCNQSVIDALKIVSPDTSALVQAGISDIAWSMSSSMAGGQGKKVAGTSLFRSRNYLLYQASLIVDLNTDLISRYLRHPSKEPAYRAGRKHEDFLIGLSSLMTGSKEEDAQAGPVAASLKRNLSDVIRTTFGSEAISPCPEQFDALRARVQRAL